MEEKKQHSETLKIYTLSDTNANVFYVGCTITSLETRLASHLSEARQTGSYYTKKQKNKIIASLGGNIVADVVDIKVITGKDKDEVMKRARLYEKEWIFKYIGLGFKLCNREATPKKSVVKEIRPDYVGLSISVQNGKIVTPKLSNPI